MTEPTERELRYKRALEKIRDYGGPAFRASQYAQRVAKDALKEPLPKHRPTRQAFKAEDLPDEVIDALMGVTEKK